jgi:cobalt-zinc-cadmium efflux system outer membrane protein
MRQLAAMLLLVCLFQQAALAQQSTDRGRPTVQLARPAQAVAQARMEQIGPGIAARPQQSLTLADLESWALRNNPTIASAESLVREQQGIWRQSGLYPNPTAGYVRTDPNQPRQSETQGVFLSQEFVTAKKLQLAQAADRQDIEWRRWQLDAQRRRVLNDVRIRFYEVLGAQRAIRETMNMEQLATEGVRAVERMIDAQQATRPDLLQAEMQLYAFRIAVADAKYRHTTAWRQLTNVAGVPRLAPTELVGALEHIPQLDWNTSLRRLLTENPVLRSQRSYIQAARIDVRLARAQAVPNLNVQMVLQHDQVMKYNQVSTLAALPLPIFNRNQGNIDFANAELRHQQQEYQRIELALQDQLAGAFNEYLSAKNHAEMFQHELLPRAKENLDLTLRGQKLGEFDLARVVNARQQYFQTTLAYVDALTALHKVAIEVEGLELTGGLNPTEIGTALQRQPGGTASTRNVLLQQLQQQGLQGSQMLPGSIQGATR